MWVLLLMGGNFQVWPEAKDSGSTVSIEIQANCTFTKKLNAEKIWGSGCPLLNQRLKQNKYKTTSLFFFSLFGNSS